MQQAPWKHEGKSLTLRVAEHGTVVAYFLMVLEAIAPAQARLPLDFLVSEQ